MAGLRSLWVLTALLGRVVKIGSNEFAIENPKIDEAV
jgi:hypothetical protein